MAITTIRRRPNDRIRAFVREPDATSRAGTLAVSATSRCAEKPSAAASAAEQCWGLALARPQRRAVTFAEGGATGLFRGWLSEVVGSFGCVGVGGAVIRRYRDDE
jgi:hypothetical protein